MGSRKAGNAQNDSEWAQDDSTQGFSASTKAVPFLQPHASGIGNAGHLHCSIQEECEMSESLSRREFLQVSSAAAWVAGSVPLSAHAAPPTPAREPYRGTFCLFSKPVPQLSWQELAQSAKRAGFGGIDLTVRREGHVLPKNVVEDLPKAVAIIRGEGMEVPMITTELLTADDPTADPILSTAGKLSIPVIKPGYYHYKFVDVRKELEEAGAQFRTLVDLAHRHGVQVGFHNHSGYIGAPVWDIAEVMDPLDPKAAGYYFDLAHATIEGGLGGWRISSNLIMPRLKMISAKDFYWDKDGARDWRIRTCPFGEGMCHWKEYLKTVAASNFHGLISYQLEYEIEGVSDDQGRALSRDKCDVVMASATKDLAALKALVREAYEGA
jgi:L-ribulose-5-phosphate 3-epimerase